ncbi:alpha/beta hydrolase [Rhodanobacter hydrolyticus]|uniref:Alpha/beta hydrolase n=1 Tax=Rhodanobacter hydrolyticus TaxID=2250595 RepID=A0ABW8J9U2_9GAMM
MKPKNWLAALGGAIAMAMLVPPSASAQTGMFRRALMQRRLQQQGAQDPMAVLPPGVRAIHDVAYGSDAQERFDVYLPQQPVRGAPVIFLVHGGAWAFGDKASARVVENKVARWVPRGFIVVSANYPLIPAATPLRQAQDLGLALATAQRMAASWGGDRLRFILMGHSAGAHLVSLISALPSLALRQGATPWLGTVALDSAAYDVTEIMQNRHLRLYDTAFGNDPSHWAAASPQQQLDSRLAPFLAVCSTQRADSCPQARRFVAKAAGLGTLAQVRPEDLSHEEINEQLGQPSDYTAAVEAFMRNLDPAVARRLDADSR